MGIPLYTPPSQQPRRRLYLHQNQQFSRWQLQPLDDYSRADDSDADHLVPLPRVSRHFVDELRRHRGAVFPDQRRSLGEQWTAAAREADALHSGSFDLGDENAGDAGTSDAGTSDAGTSDTVQPVALRDSLAEPVSDVSGESLVDAEPVADVSAAASLMAAASAAADEAAQARAESRASAHASIVRETLALANSLDAAATRGTFPSLLPPPLNISGQLESIQALSAAIRGTPSPAEAATLETRRRQLRDSLEQSQAATEAAVAELMELHHNRPGRPFNDPETMDSSDELLDIVVDMVSAVDTGMLDAVESRRGGRRRSRRRNSRVDLRADIDSQDSRDIDSQDSRADTDTAGRGQPGARLDPETRLNRHNAFRRAFFESPSSLISDLPDSFRSPYHNSRLNDTMRDASLFLPSQPGTDSADTVDTAETYRPRRFTTRQFPETEGRPRRIDSLSLGAQRQLHPGTDRRGTRTVGLPRIDGGTINHNMPVPRVGPPVAVAVMPRLNELPPLANAAPLSCIVSNFSARGPGKRTRQRSGMPAARYRRTDRQDRPGSRGLEDPEMWSDVPEAMRERLRLSRRATASRSRGSMLSSVRTFRDVNADPRQPPVVVDTGGDSGGESGVDTDMSTIRLLMTAGGGAQDLRAELSSRSADVVAAMTNSERGAAVRAEAARMIEEADAPWNGPSPTVWPTLDGSDPQARRREAARNAARNDRLPLGSRWNAMREASPSNVRSEPLPRPGGA